MVRDSKDRVLLVDFSPLLKKCTESLAFEWDELLNDVSHTLDPEILMFQFNILSI